MSKNSQKMVKISKNWNFRKFCDFFDIFGQFLGQDTSFKTQNSLNWKNNISTFNKAEKDGMKSKMADTGGLRPPDDLMVTILIIGS